MDKSRIQYEPAVEFVSEFDRIFYQTVSHNLGFLIEDGFLKEVFEKNPSKTVEKAQLMIDRFSPAADPKNFTAQAQVTNIQTTTLSLIFSIALSVSSKSWENFKAHFFLKFGDVGDDIEDEFDDSSEDRQFEQDAAEFIRKSKELRLQTPKPVVETPPILPDVEMTLVDQPVTPETSQKKDKQKARVTDDKQAKNQSTTADPDAKTSAKNPKKDKKSSIPDRI
ncbi:unnamed protein product [Rhizophagus irregularis]|uniref:Uncharacterized protein n=1 Tax=Rhizophagus irregularis TaxID=588596 RepID=A0A2I1HJB1_9GLOM|nr:hypothetical protein RhiirA4_481290 [Rhizophagus irregularis]CAB4404643.1 unnamed protein product [Rhizophagus irregularis]